MNRKKYLVLNFAIVFIISILLIRDRSFNELLQVVINQEDRASITIPGYVLECSDTGSLRCEINIDRLPLVVKATSYDDCQATYGKQIVPCWRTIASANDLIAIKGLQLSQEEQNAIKNKVWVRSIASPRILGDGIANGILLQILLFMLSISSSINVFKCLYGKFRQLKPDLHKSIIFLGSSIGGIGCFLFLLVYFFALLMTYGYIG
ncbi:MULTISPECIES: hypothetical protein [unclassified Microcoleus]|uniref:hypothetical protein n=1 Tax=unclassified Microcoleus TaxID=2642155 RepID=UPI001D7DFB7D|nr:MULTISPECIES: hypothetical protein [unclassified Microcoleus]MCC3506129.1 hypothetical protein [Microcoleus sp. PH2017_19_SFW_U_A]TAF97317.1 MAG: hypothetical protein EAZ45_22120 [Oscillatoriales cyanobacterium]MCC3438208.1 hypothetical protein [Microcoleus sp. PH2017_05_CCC_O_A]MCC3524513.1 hypothetical protein [Microcoleus sp. PH2017_20_SFW_D_A]MCC3555237.1 hypothetical protein [Microcoleus sp. PH2017_35_SFW_U_B]